MLINVILTTDICGRRQKKAEHNLTLTKFLAVNLCNCCVLKNEIQLAVYCLLPI